MRPRSTMPGSARCASRQAATTIPLAMTECHFALPGRNRCEVLSTWAAGVANARLLNVHERHGDVLKIATLADFCGTRWQVNAIMIPTPGGKSYMMPVALVMALYRHHTGEQAVRVTKAPEALDVTASRTRRPPLPPRGQHEPGPIRHHPSGRRWHDHPLRQGLSTRRRP